MGKGKGFEEAAEAGQTKDLERLLNQYGRSINDHARCEALCRAAVYGKADTVDYLLDKVVSKHAHRGKAKALQLAAVAGQTETVKLLLDCRSIYQKRDKWKAFQLAAEAGQTEIVKLLHERYGNQIPSAYILKGLNGAVMANHLRTTSTIIELYGNKFGAKSHALQLAAVAGQTECFITLLEKGGKRIYINNNIALIDTYFPDHQALQLLKKVVSSFDDLALDDREKAATAFFDTYRSFSGMTWLYHIANRRGKPLEPEHVATYDDRINQLLNILDSAPGSLKSALKKEVSSVLDIDEVLLELYEGRQSGQAFDIEKAVQDVTDNNNSKREQNFSIIHNAIEKAYPVKENTPNMEEDKVKLLLRDVIKRLEEKGTDFTSFDPLQEYKNTAPTVGLPSMPQEILESMLACAAGVSSREDDNHPKGKKIADILTEHSKDPENTSHVGKLIQQRLVGMSLAGGGPAATAV